jgi:ribosomal protein S18 acetylase RimI-like enzyme
MHAAEQYLMQHGCDVLRVEVFVPNQGAHAFYRKLGYQDMDIDMVKVVVK